MAKDDPHFRLRIPRELKEAIEEEAETNGRSINAEIVYRLENTFDPNFHGSEFRQLKSNYEAVTSIENRFLMMLAEKRVLYVVLDAAGYPISWPETMAHLNAISAALDEPVDRIDAAVFTPARVSSDKREEEWFALLNFYREKRGK
jgi:hypothetical protein